MPELAIKVPDFEGPLDILIHLIEKDKLDIYDIPIASVTEQYISYLHTMQDFDMDVATGFVVMDVTTYDQLTIPAETFGDAKDYLLEGMTITVATHEGVPLYIDLPASVELEITYTEPGLQGDRSTGGTKPATLETGKQIQVPLFITNGERVKVSTQTGEYLGRVTS